MNKLMRIVILLWLVILASGCSSSATPFTGSNAVSLASNIHIRPPAPILKNAASIRISSYTDARLVENPHKLGTGAEFVAGLRGRDIMLDQEVSLAVAGLMQQSLEDAGFTVGNSDSSSLFELAGTIRELSYNVKARDEISIAVETTLKDARSNKIIWSGLVTEKSERFAGVAGNSTRDVANNLLQGLGIVTKKTTEAISASLKSTRPELFSKVPTSNAMPGVTVFVAPDAIDHTPSSGMPPFSKPLADVGNGLLLINTTPPRAKIYLDDVYYGFSPLRAELTPGVYLVTAKLEGYKPSTEKVSVRRGESTEMELHLKH